jgi:hypothetical protein
MRKNEKLFQKFVVLQIGFQKCALQAQSFFFFKTVSSHLRTEKTLKQQSVFSISFKIPGKLLGHFGLPRHHGDQIGRSFAYWVIAYFKQFFENYRSSSCCPRCKLCSNFGKKMVGLQFGRFVHHLIRSPCY